MNVHENVIAEDLVALGFVHCSGDKWEYGVGVHKVEIHAPLTWANLLSYAVCRAYIHGQEEAKKRMRECLGCKCEGPARDKQG